jgi:hypothetical protein
MQFLREKIDGANLRVVWQRSVDGELEGLALFVTHWVWSFGAGLSHCNPQQ